ncbi:MAG: diaminopimelate epimerase [Eubacteriales bacterium]|jgi:diaminopimelate epimerase
MRIGFTKMQGLGNDYIVFDCQKSELPEPSRLAVQMTRRRFSVGADGVILVCRSEAADVKMRIFNADGSEAGMCGNGIRCVGKFVYDRGIIKAKKLSVETLSGIRQLELFVGNDGRVNSVRVDMGEADFSPAGVPVLSAGPVINQFLTVLGQTYNVTCLSVGNPHAVVILPGDPDKIDIERVGPALERHELFPERTNVEFIRVSDRKNIEMRVWERGSGETLACGTGACAAVAASARLGLCDFNTPVTVKLPGGELVVVCESDYHITMEGPAATVYEGGI